jgi:hypothetical protein
LKPVYYILLTINLILAAVLLFFFVWGLSDGTVSSFNGLLWLVMLAVPGALLAGGWLAWTNGNRVLAIVLLLVPAIPAALMALFFLMIIIIAPDWK